MLKNLVYNPNFIRKGNDIDKWVFISPNPNIAPKHFILENNCKKLNIEANGDKHIYACWQGNVNMEKGKWYKASVTIEYLDIENPELSIFAQVGSNFLVPKEKFGKSTLLEQVFQYTEDDYLNIFEVCLRATQKGSISFYNPIVCEIEKPNHRMARIATIRFGKVKEYITIEEQQKRIEIKLDEAGVVNPYLVVLPEFAVNLT